MPPPVVARNAAARAQARGISRASAEPLYLQLAGLLGRDIASGQLAAGERLPAEPELMARHGVSRVTVRQAVAILARNGQVAARRGKGTFVLAPMVHHDLGALRGFYDALREQGLEPQTELLEFAPHAGRGDPQLPDGLDLPVRLRRRYLLEGRAFAVVEAWLPAVAATLGAEGAAQLTVYQILDRLLGERVQAADVAIRCQPAPAKVARELGLRKGAMVLVMERRSTTLAQRLVEFMRIHIVPERYEFRLRVPGPLEITSSVRQASATRRARG